MTLPATIAAPPTPTTTQQGRSAPMTGDDAVSRQTLSGVFPTGVYMRKTIIDVPPLLRLQVSITDRDDRLLGWLYDHGVLKTDQIAHALQPYGLSPHWSVLHRWWFWLCDVVLRFDWGRSPTGVPVNSARAPPNLG